MALNFIRRAFSTTRIMRTIKNVTVVGAGMMGSGIAQVVAQSGYKVILIDINSEILKKSENSISTSLNHIAKKLYPDDVDKFINDVKGRITLTTNITDAVHDSDLAIEAIFESLEMKQKLFNRLDQAAPRKTIFASNTSSLGISSIAAATKRVDRFLGLHFFSPVPVMKLLEVVKTEFTSEVTYKELLNFGKSIGKVCITCKDTPGFIVNRLLIPYIAEAVRLLERGDATAKDIDTAMKLGGGYPMGPLELADYIGIDVVYFILKGWQQKFPDVQIYKPPLLLVELFKAGNFGVKSGEENGKRYSCSVNSSALEILKLESASKKKLINASIIMSSPLDTYRFSLYMATPSTLPVQINWALDFTLF